MRALLLAAGVGSRLRPLTDVVPKCLTPIRGRPLLEHWFDMLLPSCVTEILVNVHHHADLVESFVKASAWAGRVTVVREEHLLGTGGTVRRNAGFFSDGAPFMVAHADNLSLFRPDDVARAHAGRPPHCALTMMTFRTPDPKSCGIVTLDAAGVVTGFYEKVEDPPGNLANAAVYVFEPEILEFLASLGKERIDLSTELLPAFVGRIFTFENSIYHRDIGTLWSWRRAQEDFPGDTATSANASWARHLQGGGGRVQAAIDRLLWDDPER